MKQLLTIAMMLFTLLLNAQKVTIDLDSTFIVDGVKKFNTDTISVLTLLETNVTEYPTPGQDSIVTDAFVFRIQRKRMPVSVFRNVQKEYKASSKTKDEAVAELMRRKALSDKEFAKELEKINANFDAVKGAKTN